VIMSGCNLGYGLYDHLAAAGLGGCAGVPGTCGPSLWAQDGGETFTHELAHNYNRRHAASPGGGEKQVDSNYRPVGVSSVTRDLIPSGTWPSPGSTLTS